MKLERNIRAASLADWPSIAALLNEAVLPLAGAEAHLDDFLVMDEGDRMVGVAGLERYGHVALLRSVAVQAAHRHTGIGRQLFDALCAKARRDEVRGLYLLTTTAAPYFEQLGFEIRDRRDAPAALMASAEFRGVCPASATFMALELASARWPWRLRRRHWS